MAGLLLPHLPGDRAPAIPQQTASHLSQGSDGVARAENLVHHQISSASEALSIWEVNMSDVIALLAVIVALFLGAFGDLLKSMVNRPKLTLKLVNESGDMTNAGGINGTARVYFHLSVENKNRMASIHDVQVCLLDVIVELDGHEAVHGYAGPIPLAWRHNLGGGDGTNPRSIGAPCEADLCNLGQHDLRLSIPLRKDVNGQLTGAPFRLPSYILNGQGVWAGDGRAQFNDSMIMRIFAQARGTEADSEIIEIKISWVMTGPNDPDLGFPLPEVSRTRLHPQIPMEVLEGRQRAAPARSPISGRLYWGGVERPVM